ncbi:MAG TPA: hypothetical protein ENN38_03370 [Actinobacteria bacterium]|nr:hypothetical protein [Actinomycetota bacterium]
MVLFLCFFVMSFLSAVIFIKALLNMLSKSKYNRINFRNELIPAGTGLLIPLVFIIVLVFYMFFGGRYFSWVSNSLLILLVLVLGLALFGVLDDLLGDRSVGGFSGHFGELFKGNLTTGVLKAIGGVIISFFAAAPFSVNIFVHVLNTLLIALFINVFNLLDLRPGRTLKVFLLLGLIVSVFSWQSAYWSTWGIFLGPAIVLLWVDLTERGMLGDVGSNVLGGFIGFSCVVSFSETVNLFVFVILVAVNLYSESNSITGLIKKNSILRWLDEMGRKV